MSVDWSAVWLFVKPILREALIAFLMALLVLLGYDQVIPSRFARMERSEQMKALGVSNVETSRRHDGRVVGGG